MITKIRKRDGREVPFIWKIANAILKLPWHVECNDYNTAMELANQVARVLNQEMDGQVLQ